MIRSLSNSFNCEKCLLARLTGMFRLTKVFPQRQYSETVAFGFQARSRRALLERDLIIWKAAGVNHILEGIVGRVSQFVDECCLADKWYLGDLTAQTVLLPIKSRALNCVPLEYSEGQLELT
ncbi:hypothetical protein TNCV_4467681 [Trichonephila clavipes]|nr:hypothetical protein TNCV_4467681 [Trichonephila clavipes]